MVRWDDILTLVGTQNCWDSALDIIKTALDNKMVYVQNGCQEKVPKANIIRRYLKLSPKEYRKRL